MNSKLRQAVPLLWVAGGFVCLNVTASSIATLQSSVAPFSPGLANGLSVLLVVGFLGLLGTAGWWWKSLQAVEPPKTQRPKRPLKATSASIERELAKAELAIANLHDDAIQRSLVERVRTQQAQVTSETLRIVLFGTSSAGKTSTINALLGHPAGETAPTLGTTQQAENHTYTLPGFNGAIELVDTPGLQTVGESGEAEATRSATEADLLVFVVSEDLDAIEYAALQTFSEQGKRALLALNKSDCRLPDDNQAIVERLRDKTKTWMPAEQVVEIAAAPSPILVREMGEDDSFVESEVARAPDVRSLIEQFGTILQREGKQLRLAAAMVRAQNLATAVDGAIAKDRRDRAERVVQRMQWATAGAVAATPLPALDLVAAAAINARTIVELHDIYERDISLRKAQKMAKVSGKLVLKLGGVELASQAVGSILKATPLAAIGIPLQAASAAYLTRVAGLSYLDWLESETPWNEESMMERLRSQLKRASRTKLTRQVVAKTLKLIRTEGTRLASGQSAKPSKRRKPRAVKVLSDPSTVPLAFATSLPPLAECEGDRASSRC